MSDLRYTMFENRGVLQISGGDATEFLQGMVSNDIDLVTPDVSVYAALLTPQGKFMFDFLVVRQPGAVGYYLDCDRARLPDLLRRLSMYKLRADVALTDVSEDLAVVGCFGADLSALTNGHAQEAGYSTAWKSGVAFVDPRLAGLGVRVILPRDDLEASFPAEDFSAATQQDWNANRLAHGVPEGGDDVLIEKSFPLECNFDELGAISYTKGCYVGQEITARTHHRGTIRKRLLPVHVTGDMPASGTPIIHNEREIGEMRSGQGGQGIALIRLENLSSIDAAEQPDNVFEIDGTKIQPWIPDWVKIKPLSKD